MEIETQQLNYALIIQDDGQSEFEELHLDNRAGTSKRLCGLINYSKTYLLI